MTEAYTVPLTWRPVSEKPEPSGVGTRGGVNSDLLLQWRHDDGDTIMWGCYFTDADEWEGFIGGGPECFGVRDPDFWAYIPTRVPS